MIIKELIELLQTLPQDYTIKCYWEGTEHDFDKDYFIVNQDKKLIKFDAEDGFEFARNKNK
jgi:hypothetical protein